MKKYKTWEIVVALLPVLFAIDGFWHYYFAESSSTLYHAIEHAIAFAYIAILVYSIFCMYRGAKHSGRFPKLMLVLLIAVAATRLFGFVNRFLPQGPTEDFQVPVQYYIYSILNIFYIVVMIFATVRMFMARITVPAIACTCLTVAFPLLENLFFSLMVPSFSEGPSSLAVIVSQVFSLLYSLCYSLIFLHRNDFYKPETE
jgi:hypothetical protein